jgi:hypothetical protein
MPRRRNDDEAWVQLATRIPKPLHRALRLHCVTTGDTMLSFVVEALEAKLAKGGRRTGRRRVGRSTSG